MATSMPFCSVAASPLHYFCWVSRGQDHRQACREAVDEIMRRRRTGFLLCRTVEQRIAHTDPRHHEALVSSYC